MAKNKYGYDTVKWSKARTQAKQHLIGVAKKTALITYGELAKKIRAIRFNPRQTAFHELLREISEAEHNAGRGMLTALVVNKGEGEPGDGFYELAEELGFDVSDAVKESLVWPSELHKVWSWWGRQAHP